QFTAKREPQQRVRDTGWRGEKCRAQHAGVHQGFPSGEHDQRSRQRNRDLARQDSIRHHYSPNLASFALFARDKSYPVRILSRQAREVRKGPTTALLPLFARVMVFPKPSPCLLRLAARSRSPTTASCTNPNRAFPCCAGAGVPPNTPPLFAPAAPSAARF